MRWLVGASGLFNCVLGDHDAGRAPSLLLSLGWSIIINGMHHPRLHYHKRAAAQGAGRNLVSIIQNGISIAAKWSWLQQGADAEPV